MKAQFRPYVSMNPIVVTLTGTIYEQGSHSIYKDHRIIQVIDADGNFHDAFENEIILI